MKASKIVLGAALLSLGAAGNALAYHDGGVAYCDGCHTMHNSYQGTRMGNAGTAAVQGVQFLLKGSDQSSTCLNCHSGATQSSYHVMTYPAPSLGTAPVNFTPGGDFAYLARTNPKYGYTAAVPGERHGHNIIAADFGLAKDGTLSQAPGGTYPATSLACSSCHDPHGKYRITATGTVTRSGLGTKVDPIASSGSYGAAAATGEATGVYRLLGGPGYLPASLASSPSLAFSAANPIAVAPSTYNQSETTNQVHVAYGSGMSEWCANCHVTIHNDGVNGGNSALIHPAGNGAKLSAKANFDDANGWSPTIASIYQAYKASGDLTGTSNTYDSLIPYETGDGISGIATLAAAATNAEPVGQGNSASASNGNVMCLSCHRAHASNYADMTRWNNQSEFLTVAGAWPDASAGGDSAKNSTGVSAAENQAAMYGRNASLYATYQRSLCNKCHAKD